MVNKAIYHVELCDLWGCIDGLECHSRSLLNDLNLEKCFFYSVRARANVLFISNKTVVIHSA